MGLPARSAAADLYHHRLRRVCAYVRRDVEGGPFSDAEADKVLFDAIKEKVAGTNVKVIEMDTDINDPEFAVAAAKELIAIL